MKNILSLNQELSVGSLGTVRHTRLVELEERWCKTIFH